MEFVPLTFKVSVLEWSSAAHWHSASHSAAHHTWSAHAWTTHSARSAVATTVAAECTETVCERYYDVTAESVVTGLLVVVGLVSHEEVLRLIEEVVCSERESACIVEKELGDLSVPDELRLLRSRISVVPSVVDVADEVHSERKSPVHLKLCVV